MQQLRYNKIGDAYGSVYEPSDVKIKFQTPKEMMRFVNSGDDVFKCGEFIYKIIRINKLKHFSFIAKIERITLREYNLEKLLT